MAQAAAPDTFIQEVKDCSPLDPAEIEDLIITILNMQEKFGDFKELITEELLVYVCHKALSILERTPTLVHVHDPGGVSIIGDIHGSFCDLLRSLNSASWPSQRTLIFLGDFCDRNYESLKVILFLYLLLIRYPKRVVILRGNHEVLETNYHYTFFQEVVDHFGPENTKTYNFIYALLNFTFDFLPIAAIVSGQIFCCHGGVSQYARNIQDIARIKRPVVWEQKLNRNILIITDLLWADPYENQREDFEPSPRHISYLFNKTALEKFLRNMGCRCLIRAHQPFEKGCNILCDGLCISIHSAQIPPYTSYLGAILRLEFNDASNDIDVYVKWHLAGDPNVSGIAADLKKIFSETRYMYSINGENANAVCESCVAWKSGIVKKKDLKDRRTASHVELEKELRDYAVVSEAGRLYFSIFEDLVGFDEPIERIQCAARLHPECIRDMLIEGTIQLDDEANLLPAESVAIPNYGFNIDLSSNNWPIVTVYDLGYSLPEA